MAARFDPTRAIVYDLARGQLRDDEGAFRLNVPMHLLLRLCEHAGADATSEFARSLGSEVGRRIAGRLGQEVGRAGVEAWTEHLGGQVALLGLGNLRVERWGKALVLRMTGSPPNSENFVADVLGGALQRALGKDVGLVAFADPDSAAYLVLSPASADRARGLQAAGQGLGQVVETLHKGAA